MDMAQSPKCTKCITGYYDLTPVVCNICPETCLECDLSGGSVGCTVNNPSISNTTGICFLSEYMDGGSVC